MEAARWVILGERMGVVREMTRRWRWVRYRYMDDAGEEDTCHAPVRDFIRHTDTPPPPPAYRG